MIEISRKFADRYDVESKLKHLKRDRSLEETASRKKEELTRGGGGAICQVNKARMRVR